MQQKKEKLVQQYFESWISQDVNILTEIFTEDCKYIESYGTAYNNLKQIIFWFKDFHAKGGKVFEWKIYDFFHKNDELMVTWYFKHEFQDPKNTYNYEDVPNEFDGISIIKFNANGKINYLREFKSNIPNHYPYLEMI